MPGCTITDSASGWWVLAFCVAVGLLPLAVNAGMQWGRMAERDRAGIPDPTPTPRSQWAHEWRHCYFAVTRLGTSVPPEHRWEIEASRDVSLDWREPGDPVYEPVLYYRRTRLGAYWLIACLAYGAKIPSNAPDWSHPS